MRGDDGVIWALDWFEKLLKSVEIGGSSSCEHNEHNGHNDYHHHHHCLWAGSFEFKFQQFQQVSRSRVVNDKRRPLENVRCSFTWMVFCLSAICLLEWEWVFLAGLSDFRCPSTNWTKTEEGNLQLSSRETRHCVCYTSVGYCAFFKCSPQWIIAISLNVICTFLHSSFVHCDWPVTRLIGNDGSELQLLVLLFCCWSICCHCTWYCYWVSSVL